MYNKKIVKKHLQESIGLMQEKISILEDELNSMRNILTEDTIVDYVVKKVELIRLKEKMDRAIEELE